MLIKKRMLIYSNTNRRSIASFRLKSIPALLPIDFISKALKESSWREPPWRFENRLTEVEWYERARQNVGEMNHFIQQLGDALKKAESDRDED